MRIRLGKVFWTHKMKVTHRSIGGKYSLIFLCVPVTNCTKTREKVSSKIKDVSVARGASLYLFENPSLLLIVSRLCGKCLPAGSQPHNSPQCQREAHDPVSVVWAERAPGCVQSHRCLYNYIVNAFSNSHFKEEIRSFSFVLLRFYGLIYFSPLRSFQAPSPQIGIRGLRLVLEYKSHPYKAIYLTWDERKWLVLSLFSRSDSAKYTGRQMNTSRLIDGRHIWPTQLASWCLERSKYSLIPYLKSENTILTLGRDGSMGHCHFCKALKKTLGEGTC